MGRKTLMCRLLQLRQPDRDFWCDRREALRWSSLLIAIDAGLFCGTAIELNMELVWMGKCLEGPSQAALEPGGPRQPGGCASGSNLANLMTHTLARGNILGTFKNLDGYMMATI